MAKSGFDVSLVDVNANAVAMLNACKLPFKEDNAEDILNAHMGKNLRATTDMQVVSEQDAVVFVTGTPVDEHHNPKIGDVVRIIESYLDLLNAEQLVILRSTIFPGTTAIIDELLKTRFGSSRLAFCPERIVQGKGIDEIFDLPQIVSATSEDAFKAASEIFAKIASKVIRLEPKEAELAKLMTNSWRYLEFAAANQFYMMVENEGLDFYKIFGAMTDDYPRAQHFPKPGLAAGPCLFKDTMQLSSFYQNQFFLGQSAMLVNEGLPNFLVKQLEEKMGSLKGKKIAVLGMTFKANNDDIRESLSFKVKKQLQFKMADILINDPYLSDTMPLEDVLREAEGVILATPHAEYRNLKITVPYVDCWGLSLIHI